MTIGVAVVGAGCTVSARDYSAIWQSKRTHTKAWDKSKRFLKALFVGVKRCSADLYFQFFFPLSFALSLSLCATRPQIFPLSNGCFSCCFPLTLLPRNKVALTWERKEKSSCLFALWADRGNITQWAWGAGGQQAAACRAPVRLKQLATSCPCLSVPVMVKPPPTRPLSLFHKVSFTLHLPVCRPTSPHHRTILIICTVYSLLIGIVSLRVRLGVTYVAGTAAEHGQEMLMSFGANNDASPQPLCLFKKATDLDQ